MFPISFMYYFGTNLENRFSVPGFWPETESLNKIPFDSKEQALLLEELKKLRLQNRRKRLEKEIKMEEKMAAAAAGGEKGGGSGESGEVEGGVVQGQSGDGRRLGVVDKWAKGE